MSIRTSTYHRALRVSALITFLLLGFMSGMLFPQGDMLSRTTSAYLANVVGVGASVVPNGTNTLVQELKNRSDLLDQKEREIDARARDHESPFGDPTVLALSLILGVQLILIVTNYILDYRRFRTLVLKVPTQT
jgi:hypothetical protein